MRDMIDDMDSSLGSESRPSALLADVFSPRGKGVCGAGAGPLRDVFDAASTAISSDSKKADPFVSDFPTEYALGDDDPSLFADGYSSSRANI